jgi:microcystin-dependent protein
VPDVYDVPAAGPYEEISSWVPLLLGAIDANLDRASSWAESDQDVALSLVGDLIAYISELPDMEKALVPLGGVIAVTSNATIENFLLCAGQQINKAQYPELAALWAGGPFDLNETQLILPNLSNRFIIGSDTIPRPLGSTGGTATETLSVNQMPVHTHVQNAHSHGMPSRSNSAFGALGNIPRGNNSGTAVTYDTYEATPTNQNAGGGQSHNNLPPFLALAYMIRVK